MSRRSPGGAPTGPGLLIYGDLAPYYDIQYSGKDYEAECRHLQAMVRRLGRSRGNDWLDVACGTGRHLEFLRKRYRCVGVDLSPQMLRVARRRLPDTRLVRGDMRTFRLNRRFDAVSCLFSAIGHLPSERDVARTFANFARHLKPGGVAIVEPWVEPSRYHPGHLDLRTYEDEHITLARLSYSLRHGNHSVVRYTYLIGTPGQGIRFREEVDRGLLLSARRLVALMGAAGLEARFLRPGFTSDRGLLVGVRPPEPTASQPS